MAEAIQAAKEGSMSNLPPGCSESDIERHAEGSCPDCGKTLRDGVCRWCEITACDNCNEWVSTEDALRLMGGKIVCLKCSDAMHENKESEET